MIERQKLHFSDNSIQDFQKKIVVDSSQKDHMFYVFAKGLEVISTILCDHDNNHITVIIFFYVVINIMQSANKSIVGI